MKIVVLNGSPKGNLSSTLQYVRFMEKKLPGNSFLVFNIAHDIRKIETDETIFRGIIDGMKDADCILWAFPLYYFLVASQYKRFVELIWERGVMAAFKGKYTAALSTSIHLFDHMAHNYIHAICDDLEMKFLGSYSADTFDLLKESEQKRFLQFSKHLLDGIKNGVSTVREFPPLQANEFQYEQGDQGQLVDSGGRQVLILSDCESGQTNLVHMIEKLKNSFVGGAKVVNLYNIAIKGGCLGCIRCGYDNTCVYEGKDEFTTFFRETVEKAPIIIFAGTIRDRYLSSRWKLFFDRSFFCNHIPYLMGKQIGFLISGPLSQIPNLSQIFEGYVEVKKGSLAGIVTDECRNSSQIDTFIEGLAQRLAQYADSGYVKPSTFLGVGCNKIFRDNIYGRLRFPFQADHAYYRRSGAYDFPQKDFKARVISAFLIFLTKIPAMRKEIYNKKIMEEMVKPLRKLVDKTP
jgi:multimeric flavodoxin WrbA